MRQVGNFSNREHANTFADVLESRGFSAVCEGSQDHWAVWVRDEDKVVEARAAYEDFASNPNATAYRDAIAQAQNARNKEQARRRQASANYVDVRRQVFHRSAIQRAPLTAMLIAISILVALTTSLGNNQESIFYRSLGFVDGRAFRIESTTGTPNGLANIMSGEIWRVVTPVFLHFSLPHLVFNLAWLYSLGGLIENRHGQAWLGLAVLSSAVAGNVGQYAFEQSPLFGGMSGVVYGLLGYIWVRMRIAPQERLAISRETIGFMLIFLFLGFTGALDGLAGGGIANYAHLFGLLGGMAVAFLKPADA